MKKEEEDKLKNLFKETIALWKKIEKIDFKCEPKKITKSGNSAHILMSKKLIGRKAVVMVIPDFENL